MFLDGWSPGYVTFVEENQVIIIIVIIVVVVIIVIYDSNHFRSHYHQLQHKRRFQDKPVHRLQDREPQQLLRLGFYDEGDYNDDDHEHDGDVDDSDGDDDLLQHRGSRGAAPIQVIITRRQPRPNFTFVSLLENDQSQSQESKV